MKCASVYATPEQSLPSMPKLRILNFFGVSFQMIGSLQDELNAAHEYLAQLQAHIRGNLCPPSVCTLLLNLEGVIAAKSEHLPDSDFAATSPGAGRLAFGR
jgi:hypothetical protein